MVESWVQIVDSDGIDAQLLHYGRISQTYVPVAQRIYA